MRKLILFLMVILTSPVGADTTIRGASLTGVTVQVVQEEETPSSGGGLMFVDDDNFVFVDGDNALFVNE